MHDFLDIGLSFLLGLTSGFIGAISAGGGLISITGLIFLGLSPSAAIATSRLDALAADISSFVRFKKAGLIKWHYVVTFMLIGIVGGFLGSRLLLQIDEQVLEKAVGIILLFLIPVLVLSKGFGTKTKRRNKIRHAEGLASVLLVSIYAGIFGGAAGIFLIYVLIFFYGMSFIQANASRKLWGASATLAALVTFISAGIVDFTIGIPLTIGAIIGAYVGTSTAIKEGNDFVRWVFLIMVIASALVLLF